jgi:hypothetical protein
MVIQYITGQIQWWTDKIKQICMFGLGLVQVIKVRIEHVVWQMPTSTHYWGKFENVQQNEIILEF